MSNVQACCLNRVSTIYLGEMPVEGHNALADAAFSDLKLGLDFLGIE